MPAPATHRQQAEALAIARAAETLAALDDLPARCARLGLEAGAQVQMPFLGRTLALRPPSFEAAVVETGLPAKPAERLLALHYLLCDGAVVPENRWIAFRDFPGGTFYWEPFRSRAVQPLAAHIGNRLDLLRERLPRVGGRVEEATAEGLHARIRAVGRVELLLVYRTGDEEFPAGAELLFDACARRVFGAEDAAVLASRACLGLLA